MCVWVVFLGLVSCSPAVISCTAAASRPSFGLVRLCCRFFLLLLMDAGLVHLFLFLLFSLASPLPLSVLLLLDFSFLFCSLFPSLCSFPPLCCTVFACPCRGLFPLHASGSPVLGTSFPPFLAEIPCPAALATGPSPSSVSRSRRTFRSLTSRLGSSRSSGVGHPDSASASPVKSVKCPGVKTDIL